jgi:hypothetical protein
MNSSLMWLRPALPGRNYLSRPDRNDWGEQIRITIGLGKQATTWKTFDVGAD